jgi:signal transduction histidine kinase
MLDGLGEASDRQREFISDASHELRTPIATLRTLVATEVDDFESWHTSVEAAVVRLEALVEDLFTLARLDEFGLPLVCDVDLDAVCEQASATVAVVAAARDVEVVCELAPVRLVGNPMVLERVVVNLAANAARYAEHRVTISCGPSSDGGGWLAVDDDGPGIPEEFRSQVFERFTRLESGRERSAGGAGLGLSIVAGAVGAHGGTVVGEDSVLGGARFVVTLPAVADDMTTGR